MGTRDFTEDDRSARFDAAISIAQVNASETNAQTWGITRRMAYATLARSSEELLEGLRSGGNATAEAMQYGNELLRDYLEWRKQETDILEAAFTRVQLVLDQFSGEQAQ